MYTSNEDHVHEKLLYMSMRSPRTYEQNARNIGTVHVHEKLLYKPTCPREVMSGSLYTRSYRTPVRNTSRPCIGAICIDPVLDLAMPDLTVYQHSIGHVVHEKLLYKSTCPREGSHVKLLVHETLSYICA